MVRRAVPVMIGVVLLGIGPGLRGQNPAGEARKKVAELERKLAARPEGTFDWGLHNELRHQYGGIDERKSMLHVDIIFEHAFLDDYMFQVLGGKDPDRHKAIAALTEKARRFRDLPNLAAACWIRAGDLSDDRKAAEGYYRLAQAVTKAAPRYRTTATERLAPPPPKPRPWPAAIPAPRGFEAAPGPWSDPAELTEWPNRTSRANSDPWLAENHDRIRRMRPRVLVVNYSNEHTVAQVRKLVDQIIQCLAQGSRHHGYADKAAPAFLQYQLFGLVDLRDPDRTQGDSRKVPLKEGITTGINLEYRHFFTNAFASALRIPDPRAPGRSLRLDELVDGGYVHELWFVTSGPEGPKRRIGAFEVVELKPRYNEAFQKQADSYVQAGNGGDPDQPWTGRSVRIGCVNASRGPGCFLESLSHGIEGNSNSGAIPYFTHYFREYAGLDLNQRLKVPFESLYAVDYGNQAIRYPDDHTMVVTHQGREVRVENYVAAGGNVHFPPNGRSHYDLDNDRPVLSTIEDWRSGNGPNGRDRARPFTNAAFLRYSDLAPDCMGSWLIYWRQNMPGLDNRSKDDQGQRMKNWWPFLFY